LKLTSQNVNTDLQLKCMLARKSDNLMASCIKLVKMEKGQR